MSHLTTQDGIKWNYEVEGQGEVIVFLHGWGVNMLIWRQQYKYFSNCYKTIIIDLPGHGATEWRKFNLQQMAKDIEEILKGLNIIKAHFVGSSFGGLIALKIFENHPEKIQSLTLVGMQAKFARSDDHPYGLDVRYMKKLANQLTSDYPTIIDIFFRSLFTKSERSSRRFKWLQKFRKTDVIPQKKALKNILEILEKEDLRHVLDKVNLPLQFINGTDDYICPRELYFHLEDRLPNARFDWFDSCGHFPFISKPHEFNEILEDFLKKQK